MAEDTSSEFTILDHIDNIKVPGNPFKTPSNEYAMLLHLHAGLNFLNDMVAEYEHMGHMDKKKDFIYVSTRVPPGISYGLLTCAFHWYAISACQYVRTVGAIAWLQDNNLPHPDKYVESVIPQVLAFRDKVAAHTAWVTRNKRDNDAERLASIIPQISNMNGTFFIGAMGVMLKRSGKTSDSSSIKPWSITRVHKQMQQRYWPSPDSTT